jgi:O-methyltransferase involved in polyketide biosynthesis
MKEAVALTGVPETMLWTLHNRASEAKRPDTFLRDPECVRIYESIAFDYERSFGKPNTSHPMRSRLFDDVVRGWMAAHPAGTVVELAAGLETQFQRCDNGRVQWLCVDVAEAIAVRERFLPPSPRCRYVAKSALDLTWLDDVNASHSVFVTAQGLLMYFEESDVQRLFTAVVDRFPGVEVMFDTIPRWFSRKSLRGLRRTADYQAPPMPWGIGRGELDALLHEWSPRVATVTTQPYGFARGPGRALVWLCAHVRWIQNISPAIAHVTTG